MVEIQVKGHKVPAGKLLFLIPVLILMVSSILLFNYLKQGKALETYTIVGLLPYDSTTYEQAELFIEAVRLAENDVNRWLEQDGKQWRLEVVFEDNLYNPSKFLSRLIENHQKGYKIFFGPIPEPSLERALPYINKNNTLLLTTLANIQSDPDNDHNWAFSYASIEPAALVDLAAELGLEHLIIIAPKSEAYDQISRTMYLWASQLGSMKYTHTIHHDYRDYTGKLKFEDIINQLEDQFDKLAGQGVLANKIVICILGPSHFVNSVLNNTEEQSLLRRAYWLISRQEDAMSIHDANTDPGEGTPLMQIAMTNSFEKLGQKSYFDHVSEQVGFDLEDSPSSKELAYRLCTIYDLVWTVALALDTSGYDPVAVKRALPYEADQWSKDFGASGKIMLNNLGNRVQADYDFYLLHDQEEWTKAGFYSGETGVLEWLDRALIKSHASVFHVPGDYSTIQAAIDAAEDGMKIIVAPGIYRENINFMGKNIHLTGENPDLPEVVEATVINANAPGPVVTFKSGESNEAILSGFTITGGSGELYDHTITSDEGSGADHIGNYGGGILIKDESSPTISQNIIVENTVNNSGPEEKGIGAGIAILNNSSPVIKNNTITNNRAGSHGGGIAVWHQSSPAIEDNIIASNSSGKNGGGLAIAMNCSPLISNNTIRGNQAENAGGIYVGRNSLPEIINNLLENNKAEFGGGVLISETGGVLVNNNNFTENEARQDGGAVFIEHDSEALIEKNTFTLNTAEGNGGAIMTGIVSYFSSNNNEFIENKPDSIHCPEIIDFIDYVYEDRVVAHLGMSREEIIKSYGQPTSEYDIGGPGGTALYYRYFNLTFIFAGQGEVVNNIDLHRGAQIFGVKIGMSFDEINSILGEKFDHIYKHMQNIFLYQEVGEVYYEEYLASHGYSPYNVFYYLFGIDLWFHADSADGPTNEATLRWKAYWQ